MTAKTKGIVQCNFNISLASLMGDIIEVTCRVRCVQVDRRRDQADVAVPGDRRRRPGLPVLPVLRVGRAADRRWPSGNREAPDHGGDSGRRA